MATTPVGPHLCGVQPFPPDGLTRILAGRYVIERELGRGGMATVYVAADRKHSRKVAIKVIDAEIAGTIGVDRFLREIQIAANLTHPHIVPVYDSGESDGVVFFVMPLIQGETLRERLLRAGPLPLSETAALTRDIAGALDYAHSHGVIHRDIKPDNVMLSQGHALVTDFGIAHAIIESTDARLTRTGTVVGTPTYMSPEQGAGDAIDGRADQYSLACVVFEMITGRPPFEGASALSIMVQHMTADVPRFNGGLAVPARLEQAVRRALAKAPGDRFESVGELAAAVVDTPDATVPHTAELPAVAAPVSAARFPVPLTPLVGRDSEVQGVVGLLREHARLVTLHGPGGIGKTRLALEVASRAAPLFPDGMWFVPLAEVQDAEALLARIAQAVGLRGASATSSSIRDHLRDRVALLILDNFEQLTDAASDHILSLLGDLPRLKVLVTSQTLLRVYGEHEFHVAPLSVPSDGGALDLDVVRESSAVRLFVQRAIAARPDFVLDASNASAVVEICAALDGVPLAIELAAARVRSMTPQALAPKLRQTLELLTASARDVPERQRTMRKALQWTHGLLGEGECVLFRRLSVFVGGATAQSAAAVLDGDTGVAADLLDSLADRSLLRRQIDAAGESRFTMLRPVAAFAAEMLAHEAETDAVADAHAGHFRALALEAEPHIARGDDGWLDRIESDHGNVNAALAHLRACGLVADALRIAVALWRYWDVRSYAREGVDQLSATLTLPAGESPTGLRLNALFAAGVLADSCGDYELGRRCFQQHLEMVEQSGEIAAVSIARNNLAILMLRRGDVDGAMPLLEAAAAAMREVRNPQALALTMANIGNAERIRGNFAASRKRYEEAGEIFSRIGDQVNRGWSQSHLGDVARDERNNDEAQRQYHDALATFVAAGHKRGMASVLTDLGELRVSQGELREARGMLEEALVHVADLGDQRSMIHVFEILAEVSSSRGLHEHALRTAGAVAGLRDRLGAPLSDTDRVRLQQRVARSVVALTPEARERAWRTGLSMSIDEVVRFVTTPDTPTTV